jgi:hypothetical protein
MPLDQPPGVLLEDIVVAQNVPVLGLPRRGARLCAKRGLRSALPPRHDHDDTEHNDRRRDRGARSATSAEGPERAEQAESAGACERAAREAH